MNGMVNYPHALGGDPCTVAGIRAIDEPDEGHVELEITVDCGTANPRKDRPGEHPWFGKFRHRVRLVCSDPEDEPVRLVARYGRLELSKQGGRASVQTKIEILRGAGSAEAQFQGKTALSDDALS